MTEASILFQVTEGICMITLNRPHVRNALDGKSMEALSQAWQRFKHDDDALVAIVSGSGKKAFCAGLDVRDAGEDDTSNKAIQFTKWGQTGDFGVFPRQLFLGKPTIAAINGPAIGVGAILALQCDIRIAAENATLGYNVVQMGMFSPFCSEFWNLGPPSIALQTIFTGEPLTAQDAYRNGYFSEILPEQDLLSRAKAIAGKIRDNGPLAIQAIKTMWDAQPRNAELWAQRLVFDYGRRVDLSTDKKEGVLAANERRKPIFKGK
jgi:E-phenylitaconyl-CoA hydratase